jgi:hypothetical protein
LRETLEVVARIKGRMPDEGVNPIEFPPSMSQLWAWFAQLSAKRTPVMAGMAPIAESEIGWFFRNRGISTDGWEFDAINRLDVAAMNADAEKA